MIRQRRLLVYFGQVNQIERSCWHLFRSVKIRCYKIQPFCAWAFFELQQFCLACSVGLMEVLKLLIDRSSWKPSYKRLNINWFVWNRLDQYKSFLSWGMFTSCSICPAGICVCWYRWGLGAYSFLFLSSSWWCQPSPNHVQSAVHPSRCGLRLHPFGL